MGRRDAAGDSRFDDDLGFKGPHDGIKLGRFGKDVVNVAETTLEVPLKLTVVAELTPAAHEFGVGQARVVCQERPTAQEVPRTARISKRAPKVLSERPPLGFPKARCTADFRRDSLSPSGGGPSPRTFKPPPQPVRSFAFSPDGKTVAWGGGRTGSSISGR